MTAPSSSLVPSGLCSRLVGATRAFLTPGPRMVDELECVCSVLLAIGLGRLAGAQNISWAAFSGYMVMRSHVAESLMRGTLRIIGAACVLVSTISTLSLRRPGRGLLRGLDKVRGEWALIYTAHNLLKLAAAR